MENLNKSKELILYISKKLEGDESYGSTNLNKILYFIDKYFYLRSGETATDFTYIKQEKGPTPDPAQFLGLRDTMIAMGELKMSEIVRFDSYVAKVPLAERVPNMASFSDADLVGIDNIIAHFQGRSARSSSDLSHMELGWELTDDMETIPHCAFLASYQMPTDAEISAARKLMNIG